MNRISRPDALSLSAHRVLGLFSKSQYFYQQLSLGRTVSWVVSFPRIYVGSQEIRKSPEGLPTLGLLICGMKGLH